jgi:hypothetical protein
MNTPDQIHPDQNFHLDAAYEDSGNQQPMDPVEQLAMTALR